MQRNSATKLPLRRCSRRHTSGICTQIGEWIPAEELCSANGCAHRLQGDALAARGDQHDWQALTRQKREYTNLSYLGREPLRAPCCFPCPVVAGRVLNCGISKAYASRQRTHLWPNVVISTVTFFVAIPCCFARSQDMLLTAQGA